MAVIRKLLKRVISRLVVVSILISLLITACSTDGSSGSALNWLPLVLAIFFVAVLAIGVIYLFKTGKFQEWSSAGINAGKWKIQERKLESQKQAIEQEKTDLIAKLGKKTWEAKVKHPSYQEPYQTLEDLEARKQALAAEKDALETKLKQVRGSRDNLVSDYSKQINDLESLKKDVEKKLDKSKSQQSKLNNELEKINKQQLKSQAEIEDLQRKLTEVQASDLPDKEKQAASLTKSIKSLKGSADQAYERISEIEMELSKLRIAQQPIADKIKRFKDQIATVEDDQQEALAPIEQRLAELEQERQSKSEQIEDLQQRMIPIMQSLGPIAESNRPESEDLTAAYYKIDKVKANLAEVSQEHHLVVARLEACDKGMVRNFYLMIAGILVLVVLIVVLFVLAIG